MLASVAAAGEAVILILIVLLLVVLLGVVMLAYRRRILTRRPRETPGFTLADVRRMHQEGQLSDEEYESMRRSVLGLGSQANDGAGGI
ncbi:MAG: hypothetical protein JXQ73_00675 [Phycisphaerae bacterium]|nr:hypothetical protein [Phycisphaerae bacterium]